MNTPTIVFIGCLLFASSLSLIVFTRYPRFKKRFTARKLSFQTHPDIVSNIIKQTKKEAHELRNDIFLLRSVLNPDSDRRVFLPVNRIIAKTNSVYARIKQTEKDIQSVANGSWRLTTGIEETMNTVQQTAGIATTLTTDIRSGTWDRHPNGFYLLRIIQEALFNTLANGPGATVQASVRIDGLGRAAFVLHHDGPPLSGNPSSPLSGNHPFNSLAEHVHALNGRLEMSSDDYRGTTIRVNVSLNF